MISRTHRGDLPSTMRATSVFALSLLVLSALEGCGQGRDGGSRDEPAAGGGGVGGSSANGDGAGVDSRGCTRVADDNDCFYNFYAPAFCAKDQVGSSRCSGWSCTSSSPVGVEPGIACQCSGPGEACLTSPSGPWLWCCGTSCVPGGAVCSVDAECCSGLCGTDGRCGGCLPVSGSNPDGNSDCDASSECCSGSCNSDYGICALSIYP